MIYDFDWLEMWWIREQTEDFMEAVGRINEDCEVDYAPGSLRARSMVAETMALLAHQSLSQVVDVLVARSRLVANAQNSR